MGREKPPKSMCLPKRSWNYKLLFHFEGRGTTFCCFFFFILYFFLANMKQTCQWRNKKQCRGGSPEPWLPKTQVNQMVVPSPTSEVNTRTWDMMAPPGLFEPSLGESFTTWADSFIHRPEIRRILGTFIVTDLGFSPDW